MSFYEYIQTFKDDKTPLGELAIWIKEDDSFPKQEKLTENILSYFHQMSNIDHEIEDTKIVGDSCPHLHKILILFTKSYLLKRSQTMIVINKYGNELVIDIK